MLDGTLESSLRNDLGVDSEFPIFIPVTFYPKGHGRIVLHLMQGYVFVGSGLSDVQYFALEKRPYVSQVISTPGRMRVLNTVPNVKIEELRLQLRQMVAADIREGDLVKVIEGSHKNLEGLVMSIVGDSAIVSIKLRSLEIVVTIPVVFLEVLAATEGHS